MLEPMLRHVQEEPSCWHCLCQTPASAVRPLSAAVGRTEASSVLQREFPHTAVSETRAGQPLSHANTLCGRNGKHDNVTSMYHGILSLVHIHRYRRSGSVMHTFRYTFTILQVIVFTRNTFFRLIYWFNYVEKGGSGSPTSVIN